MIGEIPHSGMPETMKPSRRIKRYMTMMYAPVPRVLLVDPRVPYQGVGA
jgi:hypothetical protein